MIDLEWKVLNDMPFDIEVFLKNKNIILHPKIDDMHSPFLMKDMLKGVERAERAIKNKEKIMIVGDYDADGVTSTYTLIHAFSLLHADIVYDIPERHEGYGINQRIIDDAKENGVSLIITCDNGIAAVEAIDYANQHGIDVIVTDHHEPQDVLPNAYAIINPKQKDCSYPFKELAGCGVAFKFGQALIHRMKPSATPIFFHCLDVVATGTVADMMPLVGENRIIVYHGIKHYGKTKGLKRLIKALGITHEINSTSIYFQIGPALNAAGRLSSPKHAVDMILEKGPKSLRKAKFIASLNEERKKWVEQFANHIIQEMKEKDDPILLYYSDELPEGILGILSSRVKEALGKPSIVLTKDGDYYKGSARSVDGFSLFQFLSTKQELFHRFGGHDQACGLTIHHDHMNLFIEYLKTAEIQTEEPILVLQYELHPKDITLQLAERLIELEPYGKGNDKPYFLLSNCRIVSYDYIGKEKKTLRLKVEKEGHIFTCIGFNLATMFEQLIVNSKIDTIDLAFFPSINEWNGNRSLQLQLEAIRAT